MPLSLRGKIQQFNLSGIENDGRSYINTNVNYGTLRTYFTAYQYDASAGTGEQRESPLRHVNKLRGVVINKCYTPTSFSASVLPDSQITIKGKDVEIQLSEQNKLPLIDGNCRFNALESIRKEGGSTERKIDNLPIPLLIYLQPENRKKDFININAGLTVNRSHILCLKLDDGIADPVKLPYLLAARKLAKKLNDEPHSPFHNQIKFAAQGCAPIAFSNIVTDRKSDLLNSLFFSAKLIELFGKNDVWFIEKINLVYGLITSKTNCATEGKLLCLPPNGPKGAANLFIGVVNQFCYYLYLHDREKETKKDTDLLVKSLEEIYDENVNGDLGSTRRQLLSHNFGQLLFNSINVDSDSIHGCHFGIPISLLVSTSPSCFGVEPPPKSIEEKPRRGRPSKVAPVIEEATEAKLVESDTDTEFNK